VKLLFAHGWGFDRHFWEPLRALLPGEQIVDDRGYFGAPFEAQVAGPCIAITHSFGTMRVLGALPPGLVGIVAINGFAQFTQGHGRPGVAQRVVDRMLRRFEDEPREVLTDFRAAVGCEEPFGEIDAALLHADLLRLRDARPFGPKVPVLSLQGAADPLLPEKMRSAAFHGAEVRRIMAPGGHLLPVEDPGFCAMAITGFIETLPDSAAIAQP